MYGTFMLCDNRPRKKVIIPRKVRRSMDYDFVKLMQGNRYTFSIYYCTHCREEIRFDQMNKHALTKHQISTPKISHELRRRV
jgi:hypothetical protein